MENEKKAAVQVIVSLLDEYVADLRKAGKAMSASLVQQAAQNAINILVGKENEDNKNS